MGYITTYIYCICVGLAWSLTFNKRFFKSLAPAFFTHTLLVFFTGILFHRLSIGIWIGVIIAVFAIFRKLFVFLRRHSLVDLVDSEIWNEQIKGGIGIFTIFFMICVITNYQKRFLDWDEFSHWGMYLKETLRLDDFYCVSKLPFAHKDYVPAITLFETIWCRLSLRFLEADAYRAIQIFMFAMIMPMFEAPVALIHRNVKHWKLAFTCFLVAVPMIIPFIFNTSDAFCFYHSIYCDFVLGVIIFYCFMNAFCREENIGYRFVLITLSCTVLVLSKMNAMAYLPMIILFAFVRDYHKERNGIIKKAGLYSASLSISVLLWFVFNRHVDQYVANTGGIQSYDGMKPHKILEVFFQTKASTIPYLETLRSSFMNAVFSRNVLIHGSYFAVLCFILLSLFCVYVRLNGVDGQKYCPEVKLAGLWILLAGISHALIMYFLYCTAFDEDEALRLASFERYMNTFLVTAIYITIAICYETGVWFYEFQKYRIVVLMLTISLFFFHIDAFRQFVPGIFTHDNEKMEEFDRQASILEGSPDDATILCVDMSDGYDGPLKLPYLSHPRRLDWIDAGRKETQSIEEAAQTFKDKLSMYKYLYLYYTDDCFLDETSRVFKNPSILTNQVLYSVEPVEDKIELKYVSYERDELDKITVLDEYLKALKDRSYSEFTVFISAKDEASRYIKKDRRNLLHDLGLNADFVDHKRMSYFAVIEDGTVIAEKSSDQLIQMDGQLSASGIPYSISSAGFFCGNQSSIVIDDQEYSKDMRGLNIVVYDQEKKEVIDSVAFDTYAGGFCIR